MAVIALLAALIVPAVHASVARSRLAFCGQNLHQAAMLLLSDPLGVPPDAPQSLVGSTTTQTTTTPTYPIGCPYCNPPWTPAPGSSATSVPQLQWSGLTNALMYAINTETYCPSAPLNPARGAGMTARQSFGISLKYLSRRSGPKDWIMADADVEVVSVKAELGFSRHPKKVNLAMRDGSVIATDHGDISDPAQK